jgi:hypothetical protein
VGQRKCRRRLGDSWQAFGRVKLARYVQTAFRIVSSAAERRASGGESGRDIVNCDCPQPRVIEINILG